MPKKKTPKAAATGAKVVTTETSSEAATAGDATVEAEQEELELLQVEVGDQVKLKQVLDEAVAGAILEYLPEDYVWDNWKLCIMLVSCLFAMLAQFVPIPFPESRPIIGMCGAAYFVLSGILQFIATFIDQDTILWTRAVEELNTNTKLKNKEFMECGVNVRSSLPRFSEYYTVTIQFHKSNKEAKPPSVSKTWSVGQFFDKDGYFDEVGLTEEVDKLFQRFNKAQYDSKDKKA